MLCLYCIQIGYRFEIVIVFIIRLLHTLMFYLLLIDVDYMIINATDITTMTTAKPKVTPIISATLPFSIEFCSAFRSSASVVNSAEFFSLGVDGVVVCLNSLSSGLMPENAKHSSKQLEVQSSSVLKLCLRD